MTFGLTLAMFFENSEPPDVLMPLQVAMIFAAIPLGRCVLPSEVSQGQSRREFPEGHLAMLLKLTAVEAHRCVPRPCGLRFTPSLSACRCSQSHLHYRYASIPPFTAPPLSFEAGLYQLIFLWSFDRMLRLPFGQGWVLGFFGCSGLSIYQMEVVTTVVHVLNAEVFPQSSHVYSRSRLPFGPGLFVMNWGLDLMEKVVQLVSARFCEPDT